MGTMLVMFVAAGGGVALALNTPSIPSYCYDSGHGWECDCPPNGGTCYGTNLAEGESIFSSPYNDRIYAGAGNDYIYIYGNWGNDRI